MIIAKNYIQTGFSIEDAEKLDIVIKSMLQRDRIEIDFNEVKHFTTLFFNNALAKYLVELGPIEYEKKFNVKNLSEVGVVAYEHSIENAKDYHNLPSQEREVRNKIISTIEED